jgi:hypothetical protein
MEGGLGGRGQGPGARDQTGMFLGEIGMRHHAEKVSQ